MNFIYSGKRKESFGPNAVALVVRSADAIGILQLEIEDARELATRLATAIKISDDRRKRLTAEELRYVEWMGADIEEPRPKVP